MDCLADTGLPIGGFLALATLGIVAGLTVAVFGGKRRRKGGVALGVALALLAGGALGVSSAPSAEAATVSAGGCPAGGNAAGHAGASSTAGPGSTVTSTADVPGATSTVTVTSVPTPTHTPDGPITTTAPPDSPIIDLSIAATVSPPSVPSNRPTPVAMSVVVNNARAAASSGPVTVKIPKLAGPEAAGIIVTGLNWTLDDLSDPANHVLTYGLAIPGFGHSSTIVVGYLGWTVRDALTVPSMIVTGSAGDTDATNNATSVTVVIN